MSYKSIAIATTTLVLSASMNAAAATYDITGLFTFIDPGNSIASSGSIAGVYDDVSGTMNLSGNAALIGDWSAGGNIITTPGTYNIDTVLGGSIAGIEVGAGQWFGALFFNYNAISNIDTMQVWDTTYNLDSSISLSSTDVISDFYPAGSGAPGHPSISGATIGFTYNYDLLLTPTAVPVPAAVWLFGSGLLGLVGIARRKKA